MAATAADTQHEIGQLRGDMNAVLDEVERRLRGGLRGVASAETRITSRRARENPKVLGVLAATVVSASAYGGYVLLARLRERRKPQHRLERGLNHLRAGLRAGLQNAQRVQKRGLLLRLDPQDGGYLRVSDARVGAVPHKRRKQTTMVKKLFWAGLVSVSMTLASVLARRVADSVWRATVREAPPDNADKAAA